MAVLKQSATETYYMGWYGTCEEQCDSLSLTIPFIREKIFKVYQINSQSNGYVSFDGTLPAAFDTVLQFFTSLECGKCYIIILKPGDGQIDLPQFLPTRADTQDLGRVVDSCNINMPVTPTTTPTVTPTITPSGTPNVTPTMTPTPSPTRKVTLPSMCDGYPYTMLMKGDEVVDNQISFTIFSENTRICHWGATGGAPDSSLVRISGSSEIIGKIVTNGLINNPSIKYITPGGKVYRGTFKSNGIFTDLVLT